MVSNVSRMFSSDKGGALFRRIASFIEKKGMLEKMEKGALVGFSGGADSVMLLCFFIEYSSRIKKLNILAVHINHCIRGKEAERDEKFSSDFCSSSGVEFISEKINVPEIALARKEGLEECARSLRYSKFAEILSGRNDISCISVAHNADDNMETVLMNILRGAGARGAAGIRPVRDNIIRPLLPVSKREITELLTEFEIPFVTDSTNLVNDYRRNFIRNEIAPLLRSISPSAEDMFLRFSENLRGDDEFLTSLAREAVGAEPYASAKVLLSLHPSVFSRALSILADSSVSAVNAEKIRELLIGGDFSYDIGSGMTFFSERGKCWVAPGGSKSLDYRFDIKSGLNFISEFDSDLILYEKGAEISLNVYKISIQADLSSAIIYGRLFLRPRNEGDSVYYGGMTHKLKKLFNDRKIPPSLRSRIPILCDERGILWVPGFGVRDDGAKGKGNNLVVALGIGKGAELSEKRFRTGAEFRA